MVRRPLLVVVLWLVVASAAFPLFAGLSSVVEERVYTLPENSEAMRALELLREAGGSTGVAVLVVDGVNLADNDTLLALIGWATEFNRSAVGRYVSRAVSVPHILAAVNRTVYDGLWEAVNTTATRALDLYELVLRLDAAWNQTLTNMTMAAYELNRTAGFIIEADRGYAEAYRGFYQLALALNKTAAGLKRLDEAYAGAVEHAERLLEELNSTVALIGAADRLYSLLSRAAKQAALLEAMLSNESVVCGLSGLLGYYWWQASRTHYYMRLAGGYEGYTVLANLTWVNETLAPLPRSLALEAYNVVEELAGRGYSLDNASMAAALLLSEHSVGDNRTAILLHVLSGYWLRAERAYAESMGATSLYDMYREPPLHVESQLMVLDAAMNVSRTACRLVVANATEAALGLLASQLSENGLPRDTAIHVARRLLENASAVEVAGLAVGIVLSQAAVDAGIDPSLAARVIARYDPQGLGVLATNRTLALSAAAELLTSLGAPPGIVERAVSLLATGERGAASILARAMLEERVGEDAKHLLSIVTALDPRGEGLLAHNTTLLAHAAAQVVYERATMEGFNVTRGLVEALAERVVTEGVVNETIAEAALEAVARSVSERAGAEAARWLRSILSRYDPGAEGVLASNTTLVAQVLYERVSETGAPLGPSDVELLIRSPGSARAVAERVFVERALEEAPEEARPLVSKILETVVARGPGIGPDGAWEVVEEVMLEEARGMSAGLPGGLEPPSWLPGELVRLSVAVARGMLGPDEASAGLARKLLLSTIAPRVLNETRGMLVARDYTAFTVILSPLGSSRGERASNTMEAAGLAERLLEKRGVGGRVYAGGEDLLLEQVREYAVRDAERAARLSELGTFIVLLLLLGSFMAALLPYLGVVLGLAVGGAIVYLAASHGLVELSSHTQSIMTATALGLGADYAGYLVYRFREEYARSRDAREAARRALERAGPAIVASALTVMIGFGSLLLAWDISFLRGFGQAVPVAVAATAAATLTLVPAILSLIGGRRWFWWPRPPRDGAAGESRLMALIARHKGKVVAATILLIAVSGYFYVTFQGTHDMKLMLPPDAPALEAARLLQEKFEAGIADPLYVALVLPSSVWEDNATRMLVEGLVEEIEGHPSVGHVVSPLENNSLVEGLVSSDGRIVVLQVVLSVDPYSREGVEAVEEIHGLVHSYADSHGLEAYVGGTPYAVLEMDRVLRESFYTRVIPAAAVLMIAAFTLIFGGLPVSIVALLVIIGAAMAGIASAILVFRHVMGQDVLWFLHIVSLAAVMGVGMDYNSFFLARALEEYRETGDPDRAITRAAGAVSKLIVGLSLVVTVAYLALVTASNTGMREMGFTLAVTVLLAGVMASYVLTPPATALLGRRAWWPWGTRKKAGH